MKKLMLLLCFVLCFPFFSLAEKGEKPISKEQFNQADEYIQQAIKDNIIPGAVLLVAQNNKITYNKAYGYRAIYPKKKKMRTNTIFDLASLTKPVATATSIMKLLETNQLALDDKVATYTPGIDANLQIVDLLTHTSGIVPYPPVAKVKEEMQQNENALFDFIINSERRHAIGEGFTYSCLNYVILQEIVEKISGMSLRDFSRQYIFQPMGMEDSDYIIPKRKKHRVAPTEMLADSSVLKGIVHDPLSRELKNGISGNAGLFSTAKDLGKFCIALMNEGMYANKCLLEAETVEIMTSIPEGLEAFGRTPAWDISSTYAFHKDRTASEKSFSHTGYTGTSIVIDPENKIAVVFLTNRVHPQDNTSTAQLRRDITETLMK